MNDTVNKSFQEIGGNNQEIQKVDYVLVFVVGPIKNNVLSNITNKKRLEKMELINGINICPFQFRFLCSFVTN